MKTKTIIFSFALLFLFSNCEKFLEEDPKDILSPSNFFSSEDDARQAVTGIYAILKDNSLYGQTGLDHFYENGADTVEPNRVFNVIAGIGNYTLNEANADVSVQKMGVADTWKDLYKIVLNANIILDRVAGNEAIAPEIQTDIIAETLFLRSLAYYHLITLWGDVPYYRDNLNIDEIKVLGRTDENIIREDILADLQTAQNSMPSAIEENDLGQASKWAAAMVMAKIYMAHQDWQLALNKCLEIIDESPHSLLDNYADVFDPQNEYNAELIWELDFAKDINGQFESGVERIAGNGNWRPSFFSPRLRDEPKNTDQREALSAALEANGEAFNGVGGQIASLDLANKFPLNDLRRPLNVQDSYKGIKLVFPYMSKLWNLDLETSPRFNHSDNRIVFRLADVYLMAAEAENELNGPANAYPYINAVRERAYPTPAESELTGLTQQSFREAIYDERKWELAGEGFRRVDLIRWGILFDVIADVQYRFWTPAANIKPYHVKLPIPLQELIANPNLLESDPTNNGYR